MNCPECGADSRVLETRGGRRRRECYNMHRFTTLEILADEARTLPEGDAMHFKITEQLREKILNDTRSAMKIANAYGVHLVTVYQIKKDKMVTNSEGV